MKNKTYGTIAGRDLQHIASSFIELILKHKQYVYVFN